MTPKSYGRKKTIISRSKHTFSLENSTYFLAFMKGGAPLAMIGEEHGTLSTMLGGTNARMVPCLSLWGSVILFEGKWGSPPPNSMGQTLSDRVGYVRPS
jgi:hypothetical protein